MLERKDYKAMDRLLPSYYFALSCYAHREVFNSKEAVWNGLKNLKSYFSMLSLGNIEVDIPAGVTVEDPHLISIGKGTTIEPGAYIKGPCVLGPACVVRHGAYIRGYLLAGERCVIGHDTEVKHSIFLNGVHAAHFNYVGDSILGNEVNLGAGTKCANLKLDQKPIFVSFLSQKIETGMKKLGAIMGDFCQIGCNVVMNPGTCLGKEVECYPCVNISGFFPSGVSIKGEVQVYHGG
jgi:NDP-sugar pyrophosphorylase family protein